MTEMTSPENLPLWYPPLQAVLKTPAFQKLCGKFHAHLSIEIEADEIERLQTFCKQEKIKLTMVDLENSGKSQTDVMTTTHYRDSELGAASRITDQLAQTSNDLKQAGFNVVRAKLEHESLPSLPTFNKNNYHEVHVKLLIESEHYRQTHEELNEIGQKVGFVPSRNPLAKKQTQVTQFINQRIYNGNHDEADGKVSAMLNSIDSLPVSVVEVKRETVVFDTNQNLDNWWI